MLAGATSAVEKRWCGTIADLGAGASAVAGDAPTIVGIGAAFARSRVYRAAARPQALPAEVSDGAHVPIAIAVPAGMERGDR
jgi:hypothetical protein